MKKLRSSALVVLSAVLITSGIVYAAPTTIQAFLQPDFRISINDQIKYHPEGLQPIVYQDRTYLPAAFIAEQLGAGVEYNAQTKVISIDQKKTTDQNYITQIEEYELKITELEKEIDQLKNNSSSSSTFSKMPARKTQNGYSVSIEGLSVRDGNDGRLYFNLENKSVDTSVKIQPLSTVLMINGVEYTPKETFTDKFDKDLFNWLKVDDEVNTFLPFRNLPDDEDIAEMTITMVVETNEYLPEKETITFKVLND